MLQKKILDHISLFIVKALGLFICIYQYITGKSGKFYKRRFIDP